MKDIIIDFSTQKIINGKIEAVQGDNTTRKVKILLKENSNPYNLTGKTVMLTMKKNSSNSYVNKGDFINLNITNAVGGEVELPINKAFTKEKGGYQLQISVINEADFEENTMLFEAVIHNNLREDVSETLVESVIFKEIKQTLQEVKDIAKNENQRQTNEQQRIQNETTREDFFNNQTRPATEKVSGFVGQVAKNTKDIERAFEVLNENSFVPYSGEDITIEHSKVGFTKDMEISGKTLYKRSDGTYTDVWEESCTLESCGEAEGNKISILSCGKNLLDVDNIKQGSFTNISIGCDINDESYIDSAINRMIMKKPIYFKKYVTITPYNNYLYYAVVSDKNGIVTSIKDWSNTTMTIRQDEGFIKIAFKKQDDSNFLTYDIKAMVENNEKATNFEPYKKDLKEILLPKGLNFNGLNGIVQDTIEETAQGIVYIQNIDKIILNGTEEWEKMDATHSNTLLFQMYANDNMKAVGEMISNKFKFDTPDNQWNGDNECCCINVVKRLGIRINKNKLETQDVEGLKKYLQANPITVYYQLAKPKTYVLNNPIKVVLSGIASLNMNTYNDITYIKSLNVIKPTLNFKAPVDTPALIGDLREKNSILLVKNKELQNKNIKLEKVNQKQSTEISELNDTTNFLIEDALSRKLNN